MKKIIFTALIATVTLSACKKEDTTEPVSESTVYPHIECKYIGVESNLPEELEFFARSTENYFPMLINTYDEWVEVNPNVYKHKTQVNNEKANLAVFNDYGELASFESQGQYGAATTIDYVYDCSHNHRGEHYCLIKERITTRFTNSFHRTRYVFNYIGSQLESINFENGQTVASYTYIDDYTRKVITNHHYSNYFYILEHINDYGKVIKAEVYTLKDELLGHVLYNYDCY